MKNSINQWADDQVAQYNINGISRSLGVCKEVAMDIYEEGEQTNSMDYKGIYKKMKKRKSFQAKIDTYTINNISDCFGISQKYATKIFEEGKKNGSEDYERIYYNMKFMRGLRNYTTQFQNKLKQEKQGGKQ